MGKNRSAVKKLIQEGSMKGFLAYEQGKVVGWCNANDKSSYSALSEKVYSGSKTCAIVCFVIHPDFRRKGIAQKLLERVIQAYGKNACSWIEAYPGKDKNSCERNYHGHLSMYEKFDFIIEEEFDDYYVVRKQL